MVTDYELLKNTFDTLCIKYSTSIMGKQNIVGGIIKEPLQVRMVHLDEGVGYTGFSVDFEFDINGKYIEYGVWE